MTLWQMWLAVGIGLLILEMLTPTMFFLNLSIACLLTAGASLFTDDWNILIALWAVFSALLLVLVRPWLEKKRQPAGSDAGGMSQYAGKKAKVTENVDAEAGVISIFGERWEARSENGETYVAGDTVQIVRNEDLIMIVKKEK